jgi:hypothetical protein
MVGIREPGAPEVEVIIGDIGLFSGKDDLAARPERIEGSSDAAGIEEYMGSGAVKLLDMLAGCLVGGIKDNAI